MSTPVETPQGLASRLPEVQVVDCREPQEWSAGRIEGSIHIPLNTLLAGATGDLDATKPTVVVCRSGARSEVATLMLQARGFEVANLVGGLQSWAAGGHPLVGDGGSPGYVA